MLCAPVAFLLLVSFLPETPQCLLRKGELAKAEKSLMFYRNIADESAKTGDFYAEFEEMKTAVAENSKSRICWDDFSKRLTGSQFNPSPLYVTIFVYDVRSQKHQRRSGACSLECSSWR
uniref:Putative sugar transporter n=1 Tax=Anopheles triannulatus TaxID=58253 RepID=A0A2M4B610_9DIPT